MTPLVSIIIPCFNAERYVAEAIQSALDQTYPHREVIVVDDGSTDDSARVIRSFGQKVRSQVTRNQGGAAARNLGLSMASGELAQFLDADDLLDPIKLERMVPAALMDRGGMPFCKAAVVDMVTGRRMATWGGALKTGVDPVAYIFSSVLQTSCPLHWKENLQAVGGFRPDLRRCQDPDLHFRLAASGLRFHQIPEALVILRRVQGSISTSNPTQGISAERRFARESVDHLRLSGGLTDGRAAAIAGFLAGTARRALRLGEKQMAAVLFKEARMLHPSGGIHLAYCGKTRLLRRMLGSVLTERLVTWKRAGAQH